MANQHPKPNHRHIDLPANTVNTGNHGHAPAQPATQPASPSAPLGLKRRHFMGTALALEAAALLAACGGGGGGGDSGGTGMSGSGSGSGSVSGSGSSSASSSASSSGSGSGSASAAPPVWAVSTVAGAGTSGADNGMGATATFNIPYGLAIDATGNVYVGDSYNHLIRKISPTGVVSTLAGTAGMPGGVDGSGQTARFHYPRGVAVDTSGHVYVADYYNHSIRKITPAGIVSTLAGTGASGTLNGTGKTAQFNYPSDVAIDTNGNLYVADTHNHLTRQITPAGVVTTLAGVGGTSGYVEGTAATAQFHSPYGVAVDPSGHVYVADQDNHCIRKITPAGVVTTLGVLEGIIGYADGTSSPSGIATDPSGNVYVADTINNLIRKISPAGVVRTVAGLGGSPSFADGTGAAAQFNNPAGLAFDTSGHLYVADQDNHRIRKITPI